MPLVETPPDSVQAALNKSSSGQTSANGHSGNGSKAAGASSGNGHAATGNGHNGAHTANGNGHATALSNGNGHSSGNGHKPEDDHQPDTQTGEPRISVAADIGVDGTYGERWVIVDHDQLRVITSKGEKATVDLEIPLHEIRDVQANSLVGVGALVLSLKDGRSIEAVRYTLSQGAEFGVVARAMQSFIKDEEPPASLADSIKKKKCPKCGDPLPEDTNVCVKCVDKRAVLSRLLGYSLPYRGRVILISILMLIGSALQLVQPIFQRHLVDDVLIPHKHLGWIAVIVAGIVSVNVAGIAVSIWRGRIAAWMSQHMVYTLRNQAYGRLQDLSLSYYEKRQVGSLMSRVTQDVGELQQFLVDGIQFTLVNSLLIVGILLICLWFNWKLTLLILIPIPVTIWMTRTIWRMMWRRWHRYWFLRASLNASINAALTGVRVVKAFAQEKREKERFDDKAGRLFSTGVQVDQANATWFPIIGLISTIGIYIIWLVGGFEVFHNYSNDPREGMTLGTLQMFVSFIMMLMGPLQGLTRIADWLSRSSAAAERVFEVIDAELDVADASDAVPMPNMTGKVELRSVRFSYDKQQTVLEDVSVEVEPGEMIGLVGHSGAGKSTIINLLSRFYDVADGEVLIDGVNIKDIRMDDLRRQIGVVLQEPFLFPGTIKENISYARPDASLIDIMQAAKAANAHDFIMRFPDGYDTYVGERGTRLSGGERQRISIARAILHDPKILILDEATASVDTETEKQIQEAIARLIKGRTTFAIAHRLSTLRNAHRLMVMERGKLVELGSHEELLSKPEGVFKRLVDMQQEVNNIRAV